MEIKNCPICECIANAYQVKDMAAWYTECVNDECIGYTRHQFSTPIYPTDAEAINAWNELVTAIELGRKMMELPKVTDGMIDLLVDMVEMYRENDDMELTGDKGKAQRGLVIVAETIRRLQEESE